MTRDDGIIFVWREFATFGAAVTTMARELKDKLIGSMSQTDREALARTMFKTYAGRVEVGPHVVEWWVDGDFFYAITD